MSKFRERTGVVGWVKSTAITFPETGAHSHFHVGFVFGFQQPQSTVDALLSQFMKAASRLDYLTLSQALEGGVVPRGKWREKVAYYLTEQNAIRESKTGKGRTPGDLLHSMNRTGDADDLDRLLAFHGATRGRHKVSMSKGFRSLAPAS